MSTAWKFIFLTIIIPLITSCGYIVRNSGFVEREWPKGSYYTPSMSKLWDNPRIEISSSCDGTNYTATFGPYIVLPLFIIPNPLWPFTYFHHTTKDAVITFEICSSTTAIDWNAISPKLILNGKTLELNRTADFPEQEAKRRHFVYRPDLTCNSLDDSELIIEVAIDPPEQVSINSKVFYKHQWRVDFNGI